MPCASRKSAERAVAVLVDRIAAALLRVQPENVIDHTVAVVIDPVGRERAGLAGVAPHLPGKIGVGVAHAAVDDGDDHLDGTGGQTPGSDRVDVGASEPAVLSCVAQPPETTVGKRGIGGSGLLHRDKVIGLEVVEGA